LLLRGTSAAVERKSVCNPAHDLKRNFPPRSIARGSVKYEMAGDLPFRLLFLAIAIAREEPLPYADRARRLLRPAKVHPGRVRARRRPIQLHAHMIAEANRADELAPTLLPTSRQAATNNGRRPLRISASASAAVAAPNLPSANVCEAPRRRSVSPAHPD